MNVRDLIEILSKADLEADVMVYNRDYGFDDPWVEVGSEGVVIHS